MNDNLPYSPTQKIDGKFWLDSRYVAHVLNKKHHNFLRDVKNFIKNNKDIDLSCFRYKNYIDKRNRSKPYCLISERGVDSLLVNYTNEEAKRYKEVLLNELHRNRITIGDVLTSIDLARIASEIRLVSAATRNNLTALVKEKVENPVYWKITDDIYENIWHLTAARIRVKFNLPPKCNIREYLATHCIKAIEFIENDLCNRLRIKDEKITMCKFESMIDKAVDNFVEYAEEENIRFDLEIKPMEEMEKTKQIKNKIKREINKQLASGGVNNLTLFN
jgi:Rha family phage regulatory protein